MSEARVPRPTPPALLVGLPILAVLLAGLALYVALVRAPAAAAAREREALLLRLTGLAQPVTNRLAPEYTDADNDLVADPPADPARLTDPDTLVFTYIPTEEPEQYQVAFREFLEHLGKVTGKRVEYAVITTATEQLQAMKQGRLHVTGLNTGNVPRAVNLAGFVPVAVSANESGDYFYRSVIIAPAGGPVRSLADLRDRDITLTDAWSNSGYRVPLLMLKNAGLLPVRDYNMRYSGGHAESIRLVAEGKCDAAAVASDLLARELAAGTIRKEQFIELSQSERFPTAALGYVYNLRPELAAKVRDALLNYDWRGSGLERTLGAGGVAKFTAVNYKDDYALVRRVDDETGQKHTLDP